MSRADAPGGAPTWRFGDADSEPIAVLARGGVLAIPTESSYGLAADPTSRRGIDTIFRIKGRPASKPLPVVAADPEQLIALGVAREDPTLQAVRGLWPAPLSAIVALDRGVSLPAAAGGDDLAVRIPAHDRLRTLLARTGPLSATSANRAGAEPILDPIALKRLLAGEDALIIDGGVTTGGPPSTLVRIHQGAWQLLRAGAFDAEHLPPLFQPTPATTAR